MILVMDRHNLRNISYIFLMIKIKKYISFLNLQDAAMTLPTLGILNDLI